MRIAVLVGGTSAERDVSLASGSAIVRALEANGHEVVAIDTAEGRLITGSDVAAELGAEVGVTPPEIEAPSAGVPSELTPPIGSVPMLDGTAAVFVALHGGSGEDGRLQALLDLVGIPYTGSGYLGSALAMDKIVTKELLQTAGVRTPQWLLAPVDEAAIESQLGGFPVVVKPSREGSTVGVSVAHEAGELGPALDQAARFGGAVLIERFIPGRELAVGILGDEALPIVEIVPSHEIYDYECKYTRGQSEYRVPAPLAAELQERIQAAALAVHRVLRLSAYSRIDFRLDSENRAWCLEANSLPGMTETSLLPKAAKAAGISFSELCERIVTLALDRASR